MRLLKITLIILLIAVPVTLLPSCASKPDSEAVPENRVVTVQRGNLTIDITASGNLELSRKDDLAFEMSGTVEEVLVEAGDTVEEGQVLAKLDTSEWENQLTALERKVTAAERQITTAERKLTAAERQLTAKKRDLIQSQINLNNAELALEQAEEQTTDYLELESKRLAYELAQGRVEDAQTAVEDAQTAIEDAQTGIEDAKLDLEDAREELDEAKSGSPVITAPFAGFITKVNVEGGDEVFKGTVAVTLADPTKFEADLMVSEMDILQVKLDGEAQVQVDAMQGLSLPAKVTHISPTATIQSGVVNYEVKVEVQSLETVMQEQQEARQEAMEKMVEGELPERLRQAIEEGRITQEEAEEMIKQRQEGQGGQQRQMPTMIPEDFQLREGLTVTVSIIVDERNDVLLVPNGAITTQGRQTFVQMLAADGTIEERSVQAGISNWQFTEVTSGLSEGEQVVLPQGTTTTPATQQQGAPRGMVPGMGRILR